MKKNIYCFLIDDDDDDRRIFGMALEKIDKDIEFGYAPSGIDAIKQLNADKKIPDFIFLDLNMPLMTGVECLIELKKMSKLSETPVIIYSTTINESIIYDTLRDGAFDHIEKPSRIETLVKYLKRVLQIKDQEI
ncbi:MAG: response regulator [Bacteroidetes bacterium]|nr:response regulator [Bacteroidota bacterium]